MVLTGGLWGCPLHVEDGYFLCDPDAGGICPQGWSCLPHGTRYECHAADRHVCGDGILQPGEQCDGNDNIPGECDDYGLGQGNLQCTTVCTALCSACGNNAVETGPFGEGEACDDGNQAPGDGCSPDCAMEKPTWVQQTPDTTPSARRGHGLVYHADLGTMVLFGGLSGVNPLDDTWVYDGSTWQQVPTLNAPAPRSGHAMVYDSDRGVTILFGGSLDATPTAGETDTWEFDGSDWTPVPTDTTPEARYYAALGYDPQRKRVVLFGGFHNGINSTGTWEYDGTDWIERDQVVGPGSRMNPSLVWFPASQGLVLFGGMRNVIIPYIFDDTWLYRDGVWQDISTDLRPTARQGHAAFFDPLRERMLIFGGARQPDGVLLADSWEFDGELWLQVPNVNAPSARITTAAYYPEMAVTLLFGGQTNDATLGGAADTWWMHYRAGDSVCGDGILGADEICDGSLIAAPEFDLDCKTLGYAGGQLDCLSDCNLDRSGCYD